MKGMGPQAAGVLADLDSQVEVILEEVAGQLLRGRPVDGKSIEAAHPELMPELGRRLRDLQMILEARRVVTEEEGEIGPVETGDEDIQRLAAELKDYQILNRIHRGGQGAVYRAVETSTGRSVAIKVLSGGPFATQRQRQRFLREIKLTARFQHPHIVTIYGSGIICEQPYYVMEYVGGTPIADYAIVEGLDAAQRVRLFATVVKAVGHAHKRGIIHRDLKPSNILVDPEGVPHILDFGLAKALDSAEDSDDEISVVGHVVGTLPYLSPEQAQGAEALDTRSDVYALAVVLFELLTGEFPYDVHGDRRTTRDNIIAAPPRRIASCLDGAGDDGYPAPSEIGEDLEAVMARALAKEPERRYQSADDFVADLERYLQGEAVQAKADHSLYVLRKLLRRYRLHATIAAGFAVLVTASAVLVTKMWLTARSERDNARDAARMAHTTLQEVVTEIDESIRPLPGGSEVRDRLLTGVEGRLEQLEVLVRGDAAMGEIRLALAEKRGDMSAAAGRYSEAQALYAAATPPEADRQASALSPEDLRHRIRVELKKAKIANEPRPHLEQAYALVTQLAELAPDDPEGSFVAAQVRVARLADETDAGRFATALQEADELQRLLAHRPGGVQESDDRWMALRAAWLENRSRVELAHGRGEESYAAATELVEIAEELHRRNPHDIDCKIRLLSALVELGTQNFERKQRTDALAATARTAELATELLRLEPGDASTKKWLVKTHDKLAVLYGRQHKNKPLAEHAEIGLKLAEELVAADPDARSWQELRAEALEREGFLGILEARYEDAWQVESLAVKAREALVTRYPDRPALRSNLAESLGHRGWALRQLDRHEEALRDYLQQVALLEAVAAEQPRATQLEFEAALGMSRIATLLLEAGTPEADQEAECWLDLILAEVVELESRGLLTGDAIRLGNFMNVHKRNYALIDWRASQRRLIQHITTTLLPRLIW